MIRIGFGGILYYNYNKDAPTPPQKKKKVLVMIEAPTLLGGIMRRAHGKAVHSGERALSY